MVEGDGVTWDRRKEKNTLMVNNLVCTASITKNKYFFTDS